MEAPHQSPPNPPSGLGASGPSPSNRPRRAGWLDGRAGRRNPLGAAGGPRHLTPHCDTPSSSVPSSVPGLLQGARKAPEPEPQNPRATGAQLEATEFPNHARRPGGPRERGNQNLHPRDPGSLREAGRSILGSQALTRSPDYSRSTAPRDAAQGTPAPEDPNLQLTEPQETPAGNTRSPGCGGSEGGPRFPRTTGEERRGPLSHQGHPARRRPAPLGDATGDARAGKPSGGNPGDPRPAAHSPAVS